MAVKVPFKVLEGLETIRRSGLTNMFDVRRVIAILRCYGYKDSAEWIEKHTELYIKGISEGFKADK